MDLPSIADGMFLLAAVGTAIVAGYQGIVGRNYAKALQTGAISILWLSVILINGYFDILVSIIAIGTLVLVWVLTQNKREIQRP
ncbi:hypothetical protein [Haladaptatus pallidirubidus]|nr:hypothetical protein [Haladaptatus pallidirubidus]